MAQPTDHKRRSFFYRQLVSAGAEFTSLADAAVASRYRNEGDARKLGIADLSPLPRTGFKGRQALDWMAEQGVAASPHNNLANLQPDGCLVARLADTEALVLSDLEAKSTTVEKLNALEPGVGCYPVPRGDTYFWFVLAGIHAPDCLLKICGVDIRPHKFPNHSIAQTSIARLSTIAIRDDHGSTPAYHLLADGTSAAYFWSAVLDAMAEFDGRPIGLESLIALN